jgi:type IV pilus assembly protein PilA
MRNLCVALVLTPSLLMACGMKKYINASKQAEARSNLGTLARAARVAYETEKISEVIDPSSTMPPRALCASATNMVPASISDVAAKKYMSAPSDWSTGSATAGWKCLKFEISTPQYYQYGYTASGASNVGDSFSAIAHGDLNGDGKTSTFEMTGKIDAAKDLALAPAIKETNPDE